MEDLASDMEATALDTVAQLPNLMAILAAVDSDILAQHRNLVVEATGMVALLLNLAVMVRDMVVPFPNLVAVASDTVVQCLN